MTRLEALRGGWRPIVLYALLALLSFPTFGHLLAGKNGLAYAHDVFEVPRTGVLQDWLAHGISLWNTHLTSGNALLAQQWNTPFAIDVVLGFVIGPFGAYVVDVWLLAAVAGISMHLFLRDSLRLSMFAVLAGSIIYMFGFWQYSNGLAGSTVPLLLWLMDRAVARGPRRWCYVLGGSLGAALILYHSLSQVVLLTAGLQLGYVLVSAPSLGATRSRIGIWTTTWLLAFAIYGPVLITQIVMLPLSNRAIWDLLALYHPSPIQAVVDTVTHYSQVLVGVPIGGGLGTSPAQLGTFFTGAMGLPALVLGIVVARHDRRGWFLLVMLLAIPLFDLASVLLAPLQNELGFLKSFQLDRIGQLYPFVVVVNTAIGLNILAETVFTGRPLLLRARWRVVLVAASFVPLAIALAVAVRQVLEHRHQLAALATSPLGYALFALALAVGLGVALTVAATAIRARGGGGRAFGASLLVALLLVLAGERAAYAWGERLSAPTGTIGTWADTFGITPAKQFLLDQPGIDVDRVLSFGGSPNALAAAGLLQIDGYQSLYPVTYHAYFGALIAPQVAQEPSLATYFGDWGNRALAFGPNVNPNLVALAGTRWLYVTNGEVPSIPGIVARFQQGAETVYEVPDVLPRAFITGGIRVAPSAAAAVSDMSAASLAALRGSAYVAAGTDASRLTAAVPAGTSPGSAGTAGTATIVSYAPDQVVIDVTAGRPGVLVLTDVMAPGWVAERDGSAVPIATVDGTFRGVEVDASTRQVVFRYEPVFTYVGFGLAIVALIIAFGWAFLVRRRDRSTATPRR